MSPVKPPTFRTTRWREAYAMGDVDDFLADIQPWFDRSLPDHELAARIRSVRFHLVRLRLGYDMDDVDQHLEQLAALASQGHSPT